MPGNQSEYKGIKWPLEMNARGDYELGSIREVIRGDIRMVLQTRSFQSVDRGGERLMRPGAYGLVPYALLELFDPDIVVPLTEAWVEGALSTLEIEGKIMVQQIRVTAEYDPERLDIRIAYLILDGNIRDVYETEIRTLSPSTLVSPGRN